MSTITCEKMVFDDKYHTLNDTWVIWAHLPHDTDWSVNSYKKVSDITCVESIIEFEKVIPDVMIKNCMICINFKVIRFDYVELKILVNQ